MALLEIEIVGEAHLVVIRLWALEEEAEAHLVIAQAPLLHSIDEAAPAALADLLPQTTNHAMMTMTREEQQSHQLHHVPFHRTHMELFLHHLHQRQVAFLELDL